MGSDTTHLDRLDQLRAKREEVERRIYADQLELRVLHREIADEVTAIVEGR